VLVSAIVFSMTILMTLTATPVLGGWVENQPGGTIIEVEPGENFTLRFKLCWNEPGFNGYFSLGFYWDSPKMDNSGTPSENFTFVKASAYLEDNLDPISTNLLFTEGVSPEDKNMWRYSIVVEHFAGYPWDDNFYVDVVMRASGIGGVPHVATDNHPIIITGTIDVMESTIVSYTPPNPYITVRVLGRGVAVSISPSYQSDLPGTTLNYSVTVKNTGGFDDNYTLTITDNENWGPTLDNYLFKNVRPGGSRTTTLSVAVPENAVPSTKDNIKVTATSLTDPNVSDNDTCIAHAEGARRGVKVSISPSPQSAPAGTKLSYTVTLRNTGNVPDNYALTASDDAGWVLSLSENRFENVAENRDRTATLNVTIPGDAVPCTEDNIRVTATSLKDSAVENSASCTAHAILREVGIAISPSMQRGGPDENIWGKYDLKYTVTVTNKSAQPDNYTLTAHDNLGWDLRLVGSLLLGVPAGENRSAMLYVEVPGPEVAKPGTEDLIIVTATSQTDRRVSGYASCVAQSGVLAFEMSVSPSLLRGVYHYELEYPVKVTNKGTLRDTYTVTIADNLSWNLRLLPEPTRTVPAGVVENWLVCVKMPYDAEPGTEDKITVVVTSQTDNTLIGTTSCIARAALVDMEVSISPSYQRGSPGETIVYLLTVKNTGDEDRPTTYSLPPPSDTAGWGPKLDYYQLTIPSGESTTTKVRVMVPDDAKHRMMDNLTVQVSAPSQVHLGMDWVKKEVSSIAQAETVKLFISPSVDSAGPGDNLTFVVMVKNVGIKEDNYTLEVSDNKKWGLSLSQNRFENVAPGESRIMTLRVAIPEEATSGMRDNVMVTVIPGSAPTKRESENCVATAAPTRGVSVSISPKVNSGVSGATLEYLVVVKNIGTENDSYKLAASDSAGWGLALLENVLVVPGLSRRGTVLRVTNVVSGKSDEITVTAVSRENSEVRAEEHCEAIGEALRATVYGSKTAYNIDGDQGKGPPPEKPYVAGDYPPVMFVDKYEGGGIAALGIAAGLRNGRWNATTNPGPRLDVLLDKTFQWMNSGAKKVLWYEGYGVYADQKITGNASQLGDALKALGYTVTTDTTEPISAINLSDYDIIVTPGLQLPRGSGPPPTGGQYTGGNPSLLPNSDVDALVDFVSAGGGLLVINNADYAGYNFASVSNKILAGFDVPFHFQNDTLNDPITWTYYSYILEVNAATEIGEAYQKATGKTVLGIYSPTTLVEEEPPVPPLEVRISVSPENQVGLSGRTLTYIVTISNTGKLSDAYVLNASDNAGWPLSLSPSVLVLASGDSKVAVLNVTIPKNTARGTEDRVTVAVESIEGLGDVSYSLTIVGVLGIDVSILPESKSGLAGENLTFNVTVMNTGDILDNYLLTVQDNLGWDLALSPNILTTPVGRPRWSMLTVIIPEDAASGVRNNITVTATSQTDNSVSAKNSCIALVTGPVVRGVEVSISPTTNLGAPGRRLNFDVTVPNTGTGADTFYLTASDTKGWGPTLSVTSFQLAGGASRTGIQLSIEIPDGAAEGDSTTITVRASGTGYENSASCTARAIIREVEISISPESQTGSLGENVTFTVVVANTGEAEDSYDLTVSDNAGWGAMLLERLLTVPADENRTTTVSVTVPSDATDGDSTTITVTATSRSDPSASDTATCTAEARKKAPFPILPIGVGGAAIGGAIAVTLLLKKGTISPTFLRSRRRGMFSSMNLNQSRPSKQSLLTPRPFRPDPGKERRPSKKWV